ncbi:hypothetical protein [Mesorhizobium sp. 128a]
MLAILPSKVLAAVDEFILAADTPHGLQGPKRGRNPEYAVFQKPIFTGP